MHRRSTSGVVRASRHTLGRRGLAFWRTHGYSSHGKDWRFEQHYEYSFILLLFRLPRLELRIKGSTITSLRVGLNCLQRQTQGHGLLSNLFPKDESGWASLLLRVSVQIDSASRFSI